MSNCTPFRPRSHVSNPTATPSHIDAEIPPCDEALFFGLDPVPSSFLLQQSRSFAGIRLKPSQPEIARYRNDDEGNEEEFLGASVADISGALKQRFEDRGVVLLKTYVRKGPVR